MRENARGLCLSVRARTVREIEEAASLLPPEVQLAELRLDLLDPSEVTSGDWMALPRDPSRTWVLTWRSPEEGGGGSRPAGILQKAVEAGFPWIDVEARELDAGNPEAVGVPSDRRWVSHHRAEPPRSRESLFEIWKHLCRHEAALHKLVVPAGGFEVNDWVLDLGRRATTENRPRSIFAQGWVGHVSRILGHLEGNAVTFVARDGSSGTAPGQPTVSQVVKEYALPNVVEPPELYGVLGQSVGRSLSPALHNHAFQAAGINGLYVPLESPRAEPVLDWMRRGRLAGLSVTAPFKERCFDLIDDCEAPARQLGAVNTLWMEGDKLTGANTDMIAAREILSELQVDPAGRMALLGAGGAAASVLAAARELGLGVTVFNRTGPRGRTFSARFGVTWGGLLEELDLPAFDVVANATPLGVGEELPESVRKQSLRGPVLDLAYGSRPSEWEEFAARHGVPYRGGREFLARQAVGQFRRWTGRDVEIAEFMKGFPEEVGVEKR